MNQNKKYTHTHTQTHTEIKTALNLRARGKKFIEQINRHFINPPTASFPKFENKVIMKTSEYNHATNRNRSKLSIDGTLELAATTSDASTLEILVLGVEGSGKSLLLRR